jgi:hypothetical protein
MDSCWFAIDCDGHVAFFDTDEDGLVPDSAFFVSWAVEGADEWLQPLLDTLRQLRNVPDDDEPVWFDPRGIAQLGLFVYRPGSTDVPGPYERSERPKAPIHIDQFPPEVRRRLGGLRFPFCFARTRRLWPADHGECFGWDPAYLASDGKTVRPLPGMEEDYQQFVADLIDDLGDELAGLYFEGLEPQPRVDEGDEEDEEDEDNGA